jgi:1,5-anhydro-D-fructose reductase (1,5-anhydro-D-mannitol-forming)
MLRWLVVGIGDIATKRVIPAILEERRSRLTAFVTRDAAKAGGYGVPSFASLDEALNAASFEAVYIATPVFLHAPQTLAALRAGLHVLCEKPMALTFDQAQSMVEAAAKHRAHLGVAYYRRAYPKVQRAKEVIRQGAIGQPVMAFACCHSPVPADPSRRSWLLDPGKAGGGPVFDIGSHRIDLLNHFFGEPQEVRAFLSNVVHHTPVEDSATVVIKYQNGLHGVVDARWNSRVVRDEFRIIGSEGEIDLSPLNGPNLALPAGPETLYPHPNLHYPCIKNFVDAVLDGEELLSSGATAVWTDWVTDRAVEDSGRKRIHSGTPLP